MELPGRPPPRDSPVGTMRDSKGQSHGDAEALMSGDTKGWPHGDTEARLHGGTEDTQHLHGTAPRGGQDASGDGLVGTPRDTKGGLHGDTMITKEHRAQPHGDTTTQTPWGHRGTAAWGH